MRLVADLHIHSHFSRATSRDLTFEKLARWAQLKGIQVVGTGDLAHPGWLEEMRDRLEPAEEGLFRLKDEPARAVETEVPPACQGPVRFMLAGEISNIYKREDRTRKIHNVVFAPDFEAVERLQARLEKIGNIRSDGRPILGLDARDLLALLLDVDPRCYLIPAHIWTPWFSLLGSKSGFDSVEACFADLTPHIFAVETGLSSDPPMNWRVSGLDRYALVSNSDAHSPEKLGREATLFDTELAYPALFDALRGGDTAGLQGTIEFFPEEGKYHFDGHRACGIAWDPATTRAHDGVCPVCGKEVTVGVMHRVEALADRPAGGRPANVRPFDSLVPLPELLGEVNGVGAGSRQVMAEYTKLLGRLGPELTILREIPIEEIAAVGGPTLAEGIRRMRQGEVVAQAGYDGEYGAIKVFAGTTAPAPPGQLGLFDTEPQPEEGTVEPGEQTPIEEPDDDESAEAAEEAVPTAPAGKEENAAQATLPEPRPGTAWEQGNLFDVLPDGEAIATTLLEGLNPAQREAVLCTNGPLVIVAGPGTGKTRTLTVRIAFLIAHEGVAPEAVLAITFTNKAAAEMAQRLEALLEPDAAGRVTIQTFHAFGAALLRMYGDRLGLAPDFALCADEERHEVLRLACPELRGEAVARTLALISDAKNRLLAPDAAELDAQESASPGFRAAYRAYEKALLAGSALDFDDLIVQAVRLLADHPEVLEAARGRYRWISVDEYQDVNLAQYRLLRLLAQGPDANLCVIGDPDQAIYGFRGADRRYFLAFEADYPAARVLQLSQNYRSTQLILDAAMQVIGQGRPGHGAGPSLQAAAALAGFAAQVKLDVYRASTDRAEAEYVVHQIEQMVGGTSYFSLDSGRVAGNSGAPARSFADFAVLYRLSAQNRLLVEAFERSGIPYQTAGQAPLHTQKAVREALAYLWLLHNPLSRTHLQTVLAGGKPAFSARAAALVWDFVEGSTDGLTAALARAAEESRFTPAQQAFLATLSALYRETAAGRGRPVARLVERIDRFMAQRDGEARPEANAGLLRRLALAAVSYGERLPAFLETIALQSETDVYDPRADRVTLMTLHAAKGLEFPVVFIVGCEEGLLPYTRPGVTADVEEERRLFYVGITRARQKLVLSGAASRFLFGQRLQNAPSRFVDDIASALKEAQELARRAPKRTGERQLNLF